MKRVLFGAASAALLLPASLTAQNRPFRTEPASLVPDRHIRLEVGFEFFQDVRFNLSGLQGDLSSIGVLGLRTGVGEHVEMQLFWTAQNFLSVDERFEAPNSGRLDISRNSTSSIGDLFVGAKWKPLHEKGARPAVALQFLTQLPNASDESGLASDVINFFNAIAVEKHFARTRLTANIGLAILSDPITARSQDDLFIYGLALLHPVTDTLNLLADFHGRAGSGGIGTEEQMQLRLGGQIRTGRVMWDVAVMFGFKETDPGTGLLVGLSYDFSF